jgi:hypothetical protein
MKRVDLQVLTGVAAVFMAVAMTGCEDKHLPISGVRPAKPRLSANPGPEESFDLIVETFRRGVEDVPVGFVMSTEGGHSRMVGQNKVAHELIPPAKDGDPYKGVITVNSESSYSMRRSTDKEEASEEKTDSQESESVIPDLDDPGGIQALQSDLLNANGLSGSGRPRLPVRDPAVSSTKDTVVRNYDLLYKNGRWSLVTKLDPETEQSIINAFDRALKTQI